MKSLASLNAAKLSTRFFKIGLGHYGAADIFIGINVPMLCTLSREFRLMPLEEIETLIRSPIHEHRHLALMILVLSGAKCDDAQKKTAFDFLPVEQACKTCGFCAWLVDRKFRVQQPLRFVVERGEPPTLGLREILLFGERFAGSNEIIAGFQFAAELPG